MEMKIDALAGTLESSDVMVRIGRRRSRAFSWKSTAL
ncbi:Citrate lyase gamma chain [Serratia liquefaciens]|nr:Citrate lyase gamma chain [Serratia liquefaciens]